jgi:hypothetical protein
LNKLGLLARRSSPDKKKRFFSLSVGIHQPSRHRSDGDWKSLAQKDPVGHGWFILRSFFSPPIVEWVYLPFFLGYRLVTESWRKEPQKGASAIFLFSIEKSDKLNNSCEVYARGRCALTQ